MKQLKQQKVWVNWSKDPEHYKAPINSRTGGYAQSNNPETWSDFRSVEAATPRYGGIGFMFADGVCGVDIDGGEGHTVENPLAAELLKLFRGTYIERSPSGSGYHIIFRCDISQLPTVIDKNGKTKLAPDFYQKNPHNGVECYVAGLTSRYFTFTGEQVSEGSEITDQTEQVLYFLHQYMYRGSKEVNKDILEKARKSKDGRKFISLYDKGDTSAYGGDDSAADLALCNILAFYLKGDANAVDELFRKSALYRPKWERQDYRERTISMAINSCAGEFYKGRGRPRKSEKTEESQLFSLEALEAYLQENSMVVRYNVISKSSSIEGLEEENQEQLPNNLPTILYNDLQYQYKRCSLQTVSRFLDVIVSRNCYNPVLEVLDSVEYDGADHLAELYEILHLPEEDELSRTLILKWLWQSLSLLYNDVQQPFGADGVLVLTGEQGIGKTSFFRKLAMKPQFFAEGAALNLKDKDSYIIALGSWICELGEIETTFRTDIEQLKAFITKDVDRYRKPYGHDYLQIARKTSFCGTCNNTQFLVDRTGNRRFFTVPVEDIDLDRLEEFNVLQLWKQIQQLSDSNPQGFRLSREEQKLLAKRNAQHERKLKGEDEIEDILSLLKHDSDNITWQYITVTQFKQQHPDELRYCSAADIGKVLDKLGYPQTQKRVGGCKQRVRRLPCSS